MIEEEEEQELEEEDPKQIPAEEKDVTDEQQPVQALDFNFNFIAYEEKIAILGASGSGKSYLANSILKSLNNITVWVYDFNHQFHSSKAMLFHDLTEMLGYYDSAHRGHYILQPFDNSEDTFNEFCNAAFRRGNIVCILDEAHSFVTKQKILKPYNNLILSGRPRGISVISISSRPASLPNNVLSNCKHVFAFRLNLESDIEFLESYLGSEVWQLMPKDKRKRLRDLPELPEHSFYYRDMDLPQGAIGKV